MYEDTLVWVSFSSSKMCFLFVTSKDGYGGTLQGKEENVFCYLVISGHH